MVDPGLAETRQLALASLVNLPTLAMVESYSTVGQQRAGYRLRRTSVCYGRERGVPGAPYLRIAAVHDSPEPLPCLAHSFTE